MAQKGMSRDLLSIINPFKEKKEEPKEVIKFIPIEKTPVITPYPVEPTYYSENKSSVIKAGIIFTSMMSIFVGGGAYIIHKIPAHPFQKYEQKFAQEEEDSIVKDIDDFKSHSLGRMLFNVHNGHVAKIHYIGEGNDILREYPNINLEKMENKGVFDPNLKGSYIEMNDIPQKRCGAVANDRFAIPGIYDHMEINGKTYKPLDNMKNIGEFCNLDNNTIKWHKPEWKLKNYN